MKNKNKARFCLVYDDEGNTYCCPTGNHYAFLDIFNTYPKVALPDYLIKVESSFTFGDPEEF